MHLTSSTWVNSDCSTAASEPAQVKFIIELDIRCYYYFFIFLQYFIMHNYNTHSAESNRLTEDKILLFHYINLLTLGMTYFSDSN